MSTPKVTPVMLEAALHYYYKTDDFVPAGSTPSRSHQDAVSALCSLGLLEVANGDGTKAVYRKTPGLDVYIERVLRSPLPERMWCFRNPMNGTFRA